MERDLHGRLWGADRRRRRQHRGDPADARGVRVSGTRTASDLIRPGSRGEQPCLPTPTRPSSPGQPSLDCVVAEDGCTLLPLTFPVQVSECDSRGVLIEGPWIGAPPPDPENVGDAYWPIVGAEDLPTAADPNGNEDTLAILPLCKSRRGGSGAFGWLDLDPGIPNLPGEIEGPLTTPVDIPDWFQTQSGNPNSVDDEISAYIHQPVLIPLNNGACRMDPGTPHVCPARPGRCRSGRQQHLVLRPYARGVLHPRGAGARAERGRMCQCARAARPSRSPTVRVPRLHQRLVRQLRHLGPGRSGR